MKNISELEVFLVIALTSVTLSMAKQNLCAQFTFDPAGIRSDGIAVAENTNVTFFFNLTNDSCMNMDGVDIIVDRDNSYQCHAIWKNGTCQVTESTLKTGACRCRSPHRPDFVFTKIVNRSDRAHWTWKTIVAIAGNVTIPFNVTCPPSFLNKSKYVTISHGQSVNVIFPVRIHSAHLTECVIAKCSEPNQSRDGFVVFSRPTQKCLVSTHASDKNALPERITTLPLDLWNVTDQCCISGTPPNTSLYVHIHKELEPDGVNWCVKLTNAEGSDNASFLLKGPPRFIKKFQNISVSHGQRVNVIFPVRIYSSHLTECVIAKCSEQIQSRGCFVVFSRPAQQCPVPTHASDKNALPERITTLPLDFWNVTDQCCLNGTPPDIDLNVHIPKVLEPDAGEWCVKLTNAEGSDSISFLLKVSTDARQLEWDPVIKLVTSTTLAVIFTAALASVIFYVLLKKRSGTKTIEFPVPIVQCTGMQSLYSDRDEPAERESDLLHETDNLPSRKQPVENEFELFCEINNLTYCKEPIEN